MKKIFIPVVAILAVSFAACGGSTNPSSETISIEESIILDDSADITETLTEKIENNDTTGFSEMTVLINNKIQELYAKGDTAGAKAYIEKIKTFVEDNQDKLEQMNQSSSFNNVVDKAKELPSEIKKETEQTASDIKTKVKDVTEQATAKTEEKVEEVKGKAAEKVDNAKKKIEETAEKATQKTDEAVERAKQKLGL